MLQKTLPAYTAVLFPVVQALWLSLDVIHIAQPAGGFIPQYRFENFGTKTLGFW